MNIERTLTAKQAKALDKKASAKFGISTLLLMENAGSVISREIIKVLRRKQNKVAIFCGTGNNGGDGFCAARHLLTAGVKPKVYLTGKISDVKNEARVNLEILRKLKQEIIQVNPSNLKSIKNKVKQSGLVVDALLGVGVKGKVRPVYREAINLINSVKAYVISVDLPSGLDATTGKTLGCCIKADMTITFVAKKKGMVLNEGRRYCGKTLVRGIGVAL